MGDAHLLHSSMSQYSNYFGSAWDLHNLEIFNSGLSLVTESSCMTASTPPTYSNDVSTGYLEDALLLHHYTTRSAKRRRRSLLYDQIPNNLCNSGGYRWWVNECDDNNLNCITQSMSSPSALDEVGIIKSRSSSMEDEESAGGGGVTLFQDAVTAKLETTKLGLINNDHTPSSNSASFTTCNLLPPANHLPSSASAPGESISSSSGSTMPTRRRKSGKVIKGLVYPFEVVKPGGEEGEVTLKDINERMLMPPTRPVRHPVGDYACRPRPYYGPGLSGKAVVALTTIHTQGRRGTITIIRTTP